MSALETFLKRYPDGENYAPHCFEFYETGYLDGEVFQFQITKSLEQQIQGHVLDVLKLREELAEAKRDAARYRAIRDSKIAEINEGYGPDEERATPEQFDAYLDEEIDAAIEGTKT